MPGDRSGTVAKRSNDAHLRTTAFGLPVEPDVKMM